MPVKVFCPACGAIYSVPADLSRRTIACDACKAAFEVGVEAAVVESPAPAAPISATPVPAPLSETLAAEPVAEVLLVAAEPPLAQPVELPEMPVAAAFTALPPSPAPPPDYPRPTPSNPGNRRQLVLLLASTLACGLRLGMLLLGGVAWLVLRSPAVAQPEATQPTNSAPPTSSPAAKNELDPVPIPPDATQLTHAARERVIKATVHIRVTGGDGGGGQGSGYFTGGNDLVVTNAHVLGMLDPDSPRSSNIEVALNSGKPDQLLLPGEIVAVDRRADLAVLRVLAGAGQAQLLPRPLETKSTQKLYETQKLYVVGFPLGTFLGREVTVSDSSVSSLRRDEAGQLERIQVNGGMQPGNSGGPVIDLAGNVVGVAVSGMRDTPINFAIPGDHVHRLFHGRLDTVTLEQPYFRNESIRGQVAVHRIDPLRRVRQAAVVVWAGQPGTDRPAATTKPEPEPGDTPHQRLALPPAANDVAESDCPLPPLEAGQVYWLQPTWVNGRGETCWGTAVPFASGPPVERKAIRLAVRHKEGSLPLTIHRSFLVKRDAGPDQQSTDERRLTTKLTEVVTAVDAEGVASVRLDYQGLRYTATEDDEAVTVRPGSLVESVTANSKRLVAQLEIDQNNVVGQHSVDLERVPAKLRPDLQRYHDEVLLSLAALTVPMPYNPSVEPLTTWTRPRVLPIGFLDGSRKVSLEITCTYLGVRVRAGREEAIIDMRGTIPDTEDRSRWLGTTVKGQAVLDLRTGILVAAELSVPYRYNEKELGARKLQTTGRMETRLERTLPAE